MNNGIWRLEVGLQLSTVAIEADGGRPYRPEHAVDGDRTPLQNSVSSLDPNKEDCELTRSSDGEG